MPDGGSLPDPNKKAPPPMPHRVVNPTSPKPVKEKPTKPSVKKLK